MGLTRRSHAVLGPLLSFITLVTLAPLLLNGLPLIVAAQSREASRADFDQMMKDLSNWGRWGQDDQMGAVSLITPTIVVLRLTCSCVAVRRAG